jgi:hypothetical protein
MNRLKSRIAFLAIGVAVLSAGLMPMAGPAQASKVRSCHSFKLFSDGFKAFKIRRSSTITCRKARVLIKAAYGLGPLKRIGRVPGGGRPVYKFRHGWRCGTGVGGAACYNVKHRKYNTIYPGHGARPMAVTTFAGY